MINFSYVILCVSFSLLVFFKPNQEPRQNIKAAVVSDMDSLYINTSGDGLYILGDTIFFESGSEEPKVFCNKNEMKNFIDEYTAYYSTPLGYQHDLQWQIENGYVHIKLYVSDDPTDEQGAELIYNGPNWTIDGTKDTTYSFGFFNTTEKLYDPASKAYIFESYWLD